MPLYRFECQECEYEATFHSVPSKRPTRPKCDDCGKEMNRVYSRGSLQAQANTRDYVTEDITGEPVRIQSRKQEDALCAENGVVRVGLDENITTKKNNGFDGDARQFKDDFDRSCQERGIDLRSWRLPRRMH